MPFKKTVNADAGEEFKVKDQVPEGAGVPTAEDLAKTTEGVKTVQVPQSGPRVLAIVDGNKKSKLMLVELKERNVNVVSEVNVDFKDIVKSVKDTVKSETGKDNKYDVVYLPFTNDDLNKRAAEFSQLRSEVQTPLNLYFQDRGDVDVANKCFVRKIE